MQQIFHEIKINTQGQGLYDFTEKTISWLNNQKIKIQSRVLSDRTLFLFWIQARLKIAVTF